jgi:hypothetical protein
MEEKIQLFKEPRHNNTEILRSKVAVQRPFGFPPLVFGITMAFLLAANLHEL